MLRVLNVLAFASFLVLMAGPVSAQYGGGPSVPGEVEGQIRQTTACGTIIVTGSNWGSATVTIDREFAGPDCPGIEPPVPDDVIEEDLSEGGSNFAESGSVTTASTAEQLSVPVNADGTFTATLLVPADVDESTYDVTVTGQDLSGESKEQVFSYRVTPAAVFTPDPQSNASTNTTYAVAALLLASALLVGLNWSPIMRRIRR